MDSSLLFTRGPMIMQGALKSYLGSTTGVFTYVSKGNSEDNPQLIGQVMVPHDVHLAHLTFLAPQQSLSSPAVTDLLDYLVFSSGENGAHHLMAEVEESTQAYQALRRANFSVYTRQRIWKFDPSQSTKSRVANWQTAASKDTIAIRTLYTDLVPQMVRQVEPDSTQNPRGMVLYSEGGLTAYVELKYGQRGVWAHPLIHPGVEDFADQFRDFLQNLPERSSKPVYVCVRSYQSWLEHTLEELGLTEGPRQAVMVKHMAITQKAGIRNALPALEGGQPEITTPITRSESN
jgi:hypothetical protein